MTREEAKAWFKVLLKDEYAFNSADREAFAMAIKALEQEPCEDVIDRAEAMTEIMMFAGNVKSDEEDIYIKVSDAVQLLRELPPVNPQPCEDAISREDALMALTGEWTEITDEIIHRFIKRIKALPPVNPQPKTGHWIRISPAEIYECSECGQNVMTSDICAYRFCHGCGAKMVESPESEEE